MNNKDNQMSCADTFSACIRALRLGEEGRYSARFPQVLDCIQHWMQSKNVDQDPSFVAKIEESMSCQMRHDNIRLADLLEFEIMPLVLGKGR